MKVLITGNMGYVGPAVVRRLRNRFPNAYLHGYDNAYFAHCLTNALQLPERLLDRQSYGDVRTMDETLFDGCDAVVHLAAVSNDPMGNRFARVTAAINQDASVQLARTAARAGVQNFVFASSCSVYGVAEGGPRREEDPLNPVTAYAASKIGTEQALKQIDGDMVITCLRFATACGMSDRLRLDLVLNDFVACAIARGEISVLSDGTPWRPLIDTADMARAIEWAVTRPARIGGRFLTVNAGSNDRNYQVRDLANAVAAAIPGTTVSINTAAPADSRSYQVDFGRYAALAPEHQPEVTLARSIKELAEGLKAMGFADAEFRGSSLMRLQVLQSHIGQGRLSEELVWQ
ncbi:NAD-dependent epimerase [Siccirubricoccus deserti]|uniref:SDR family oxidoreductase n=1 Tax=Siccirubricoccus deserti TaxID=2013562 RepID=A0A9X0UK15_9PROT|nr:SDR family oxidoreductase [Siccirubricoccus deserti]MBC4018685.1 SDR family oxidoreductase [Siccirubricoccus deserti]GGC67712.1 NAD-dependent epimerase [Siccirubricoccus deserti]